jgi:hypothetical protein
MPVLVLRLARIMLRAFYERDGVRNVVRQLDAECEGCGEGSWEEEGGEERDEEREEESEEATEMVGALADRVLATQAAPRDDLERRRSGPRRTLLDPEPSAQESKVLRQGLLGHVIKLVPAPERARPAMQEALRTMHTPYPWALCYAKM